MQPTPGKNVKDVCAVIQGAPSPSNYDDLLKSCRVSATCWWKVVVHLGMCHSIVSTVKTIVVNNPVTEGRVAFRVHTYL